MGKELFAAALSTLLAGACCATPAAGGDGGGAAGPGATSGGSSGGGTTGGGSSGGGSGTTGSSSGGPPTQAELCDFVWQGLARYGDLVSLAQRTPPTGAHCPTPSADETLVLQAETQAAQAELVTLSEPAGGWPQGLGPSACSDPSSLPSTVARALSASLAAGRLSWDAAAAASCAQGMTASGYLGDLLSLDAGAAPPAWVAQTIGTDGGSGPCFRIVQGQLRQGESCTVDFDCASGLFCKGVCASDGGSGVCQPLVPIGASCAMGDECAQSGSCGGSPPTCSASGSSSGGPGDGGPGDPCQSAADCQSCLSCGFLADGGLGCVALGVNGTSCGADSECGAPYLYCGVGGSCVPALVVGRAGCVASSSQSCFQGWCEPLSDGGTVCAPPSGDGGPCISDLSCTPSGGSLLGPSPQQWCLGADAGVLGSCAPLPGAGQPCAEGFQCATGATCSQGNCVPQSSGGQSFNLCQVSSSGSPGGCAGGSSLLLGLGGAMALSERRRRRRRG